MRLLLQNLLVAAASGGFFCAPNLVWADEHEREEHLTPEGIRFDARIYIDAVAYDATRQLTPQDALGIYNVHNDHADGGHQHSAGFRNGLSLNNTEAHLGLQIPGWAEGRLNLSASADGLELEEAWLRTQFLPAGLQVKGGKFLSDIGALNKQHPHAWSFVDQALPYQMLFNGGLGGTGVQVVWQAPMPLDLRLGVEALNSENEGIAAYIGPTVSQTTQRPVAFSNRGPWPNVWTAFIKSGGEIAPQHHVDGGLSWVKSKLHQELHTYHPGINDAEHGLQGNVSMLGANLGYRFNAEGDEGAGDVSLLAEYWLQEKNMKLSFHELKPRLVGQPRDLKVNAFTLQALYGLLPHWQIGLRYEGSGMIHEARRANAQVGPTNTSYFDPLHRVSGVATWRFNEQHQLRFQASRITGSFAETPAGGGKDVAVNRSYNAFYLQYQFNFGTPATHTHH